MTQQPKQTTSPVDLTPATAAPAMHPLAADELRQVTGGSGVGSGGTGSPRAQSVGGIGGSG